MCTGENTTVTPRPDSSDRGLRLPHDAGMRMPPLDADAFVRPEELAPGEVEVFRLGTHAKYPTVTFTRAMAEQWIANNARCGMPPLVLGGHDEDAHVKALPVESLRLVRHSLVAKRGKQPRFVEDVTRAGLVPEISIQLTEDGSRLDHIALLYGERAAVQGMAPPQRTFSATRPPSTRHVAFRFDDGGIAEGWDCMTDAPEAVVVVPPTPPTPDVAGELAAEDHQSFVDRLFAKASEIACRFRGNPAVPPADQMAQAAAAYSQAAALVQSSTPAGGQSGDPSGGDAAFSDGDDSMKPEEMLQQLGSLIDSRLQPIRDEIAAVKAEQTSFSAARTEETDKQRQADEKAAQARAFKFAESVLAAGLVGGAVEAEAVSAIHRALQGVPLQFGSGDTAKQYDGADVFEALLAERDPKLQFGAVRLAGAHTTGTAHEQPLSLTERVAGIQALQAQQARLGSPITTAEASRRFSAGERAA